MRFTIGTLSVGVRLIGPRGRLVPRDEGNVVGWAPLAGQKVCRDAAGRWRPEHTWDNDGRCIFCSAISSAELLQ
jgi:hypothetical protein